MANFLDLFPDTPAAVAGSQGARDILENQYKQGMGFMEMENALMRTVAARKAMDEQARMQPLEQTANAIKLLQGLNVASGPGTPSPFEGVNPMDVNSLNDALLRATPNIKTNLEADLMKTQASTQEQMARAAMLEGGRNSREASERNAEAEKQLKKEAFERVDELNKRYTKTPTSESKARQLVSDYQSLTAYGVPEAARVFWNKHSALLAAAGFDAPGSRKSAQKPAKPSATVAQPPAPAAQPAEQAPAAEGWMKTMMREQAPTSGDAGLATEKRLRAGYDAKPKAQPLQQTETINGVTYVLQNGKYVRVK